MLVANSDVTSQKRCMDRVPTPGETSPPVLRIFDIPPLLSKERGTKGERSLVHLSRARGS
jgi:hypothetical protein